MKKWLFLLVSVFILWGCRTPTIISNNIELRKTFGNELTILTTDSLKYNLKSYTIKDSSILGEGIMYIANEEKNYSGEIMFSQIQFIQANKFNFKSIIAGGVIVTAITLLSNQFKKEINIHPNIVYTGPQGTGSSCPYILSRNGTDYQLEGEAFSIALGKSLEMTTTTILYNIGSEKDKEIKISNERTETHYFNKISVKSVEVPDNAYPVQDVNNKVYPVYLLVSPISAVDKMNGKDVLARITSKDGNYWKSDLRGATKEKNFEDVMELQFKKEKNEGEISLLLNAKNTFIADVAFKQLGKYLDGDLLDFYNAIENDKEMIEIMRNYQQNTFLKIEIWEGNEWKKIGELFPEGNMVSFSRIVRFKIPIDNERNIKVKLTTMADVWEIDQVGIDFSETEQLECRDIKELQVSKNDHLIHDETIEADLRYEYLIPGEEIKVEFKGDKEKQGSKRYFIAEVRGFLYEWISHPEEVKYRSVLQNKSRIELLKNVLSNQDLFRSLIYTEWKKERIK